MGERQLQELSVRMADAALTGLKKKSPRVKWLRVSRGILKHELTNIGQQPYDDDILDTAVTAVNAVLVNIEDELRLAIKEDLWDEPATIIW